MTKLIKLRAKLPHIIKWDARLLEFMSVHKEATAKQLRQLAIADGIGESTYTSRAKKITKKNPNYLVSPRRGYYRLP